MRECVNLHVHTEFSIQDGESNIKELVAKAKADGQKAIAITDHGNMYGTTEMYKECKKAGIKPIIGCEIYLESLNGIAKTNHLVLLAKNQKGYTNLSKIVSKGFDVLRRGKPTVHWSDLKKHAEGIICLSGCLAGEIPRRLESGDMDEAERVLLKLKGIFEDDFYLEIQKHGLEQELHVNHKILALGKKHSVDVVATGDSHYTNKEDKIVQDIMLCLQTKTTLKNPKRWVFDGEGYHFQTMEEMNERFKGVPEVLENTIKIADKVNLELVLDKVEMPYFNHPKEFGSEDEYLDFMAEEGFKFRFEGTDKFTDTEYRERFKFELDLIKKLRFSGYFLIVQDFIMFAKNNDIMVGPGRGSCVGSLVAYCLQITDLDPIPLGLLFERFLNPERVSNPDMDIDFEYERREEVVSYVEDKYGKDAVAGIVTFGSFAARMAVRDVCRVLEMDKYLAGRINKLIPNEPKMTFKKALDKSPDLLSMYDSEPDVKKVIDLSMKLEGKVRHVSTHACGKVIAPSPVTNFMPEARLFDKELKEYFKVVQMTNAEEMGLLKFDFLGLKTMSVIGNSIRMANRKLKKKIKYLDIPLTNWKVYAEIGKGKTDGVFQLESGGMKKLIVDMFSDVEERAAMLKTEKEFTALGWEMFERLIAAVSLYRPGPMDYIPQYIEGMKNPSSIKYDTPELEEILKATYGTIVYQEQVQQIVRKLAGYSLGRGDLIRRAMSKKKTDVMTAEKHIFIHGKDNEDGSIEVMGCLRNGISIEAASIIWDKMEAFAAYAFNKSHAAAYAMIAYITAWIKYYYPTEFVTAMLNAFILSSVKLKHYLAVAKKMGIEILPPDINKSEILFTSDADGEILFGLMGLSGMDKSSKWIIEERMSGGDFKNFQDIVDRMMTNQKVSSSYMETIIKSGAVDSFDGTRNAKMQILPTLLDAAKSLKKKNPDQLSLFLGMPEFITDEFKIQTPDIPEWTFEKLLEEEKTACGLYISGHPLSCVRSFLNSQNVDDISIYSLLINEDEESEDIEDLNGKKVKFAGIISEHKIFYTKQSKPVYVFKLEDESGEISAVAFSKKNNDMLKNVEDGAMVMLEGVLSQDDRGLQVICNNIINIKNAGKMENPKSLWVKLNSMKSVKVLENIIGPYKGSIPVYFIVDGKRYKMNDGINLSLTSMQALKNTFGDNYRITYA